VLVVLGGDDWLVGVYFPMALVGRVIVMPVRRTNVHIVIRNGLCH
jgi:hypothetical protein